MSRGNAEQPSAQAPKGPSSPNRVEVSGTGPQGAPQGPGGGCAERSLQAAGQNGGNGTQDRRTRHRQGRAPQNSPGRAHRRERLRAESHRSARATALRALLSTGAREIGARSHLGSASRSVAYGRRASEQHRPESNPVRPSSGTEQGPPSSSSTSRGHRPRSSGRTRRRPGRLGRSKCLRSRLSDAGAGSQPSVSRSSAVAAGPARSRCLRSRLSRSRPRRRHSRSKAVAADSATDRQSQTGGQAASAPLQRSLILRLRRRRRTPRARQSPGCRTRLGSAAATSTQAVASRAAGVWQEGRAGLRATRPLRQPSSTPVQQPPAGARHAAGRQRSPGGASAPTAQTGPVAPAGPQAGTPVQQRPTPRNSSLEPQLAARRAASGLRRLSGAAAGLSRRGCSTAAATTQARPQAPADSRACPRRPVRARRDHRPYARRSPVRCFAGRAPYWTASPRCRRTARSRGTDAGSRRRTPVGSGCSSRCRRQFRRSGTATQKPARGRGWFWRSPRPKTITRRSPRWALPGEPGRRGCGCRGSTRGR